MLLTAPGGVKAVFSWGIQDAVGQTMALPPMPRVDARGRPLMDTITVRGVPWPLLSQNVKVRLVPEAIPLG